MQAGLGVKISVWRWPDLTGDPSCFFFSSVPPNSGNAVTRDGETNKAARSNTRPSTESSQQPEISFTWTVLEVHYY
jgi:hypothetical protein